MNNDYVRAEIVQGSAAHFVVMVGDGVPSELRGGRDLCIMSHVISA